MSLPSPPFLRPFGGGSAFASAGYVTSPPLPIKLVQYTNSPADDRSLAWEKSFVVFTTDRGGGWDLWEMWWNKWQAGPRRATPADERDPAVLIRRSNYELLAYSSNAQGSYDIWVDDPYPPHPVTNLPGDERWPSWTPDGWIIFSANLAGNWDLWAVQSDGEKLTQLTNTPWDERWPDVSPDGEWIAFSSNYYGSDDLWLMKRDGSVLKRLTSLPGREIEPDWSPDGSRIAFASDLSGEWDIWLVDPEGTLLTPVTQDPAEDHDPSWSPDGKIIAFDSNRSGNWDIWKAELLPLEAKERIAFTRGAGRGQEIYLIDPDGKNEFRLTHNDVWDGEPSWAPSGKRLAFVRAIPERKVIYGEGYGYLGRDEVWVVNADGSGPRLVLNNSLLRRSGCCDWTLEYLQNLYWAPDESALFFEGWAAVTSDAIWAVNIDGSNPRVLTGGNDLQLTHNGRLGLWRHLYFRGYGSDEAFLVDRYGNDLAHFAELHDSAPYIFAPDGKRLLFVINSGEREEEGWKAGLYLYDIETGRVTRLISDLDRLELNSHRGLFEWLEIVWAPDSRRFLYVSDRDGDAEIYLFDTVTCEERKLTDNDADDYSPSWSPDGQRIAFVSERDGNPEIYVIDADGSGQLRLTDDPAPDLDPQWGP